MLFSERLIEISVEYFIKSGIIQTLMGFHGVVEVDETEKLNAPAGAVFKGNLVELHVHQGADDSFCFTVGLRTTDADTCCLRALPKAYLKKTDRV